MRDTRATAEGLREAIERTGYYPELVADAVSSALGEDPVLAFVLHHEAMIDPAMEVGRHVTVLVLAPTRLIVCHTDEHPPTEAMPEPHASTTTETIRLSAVRSVALTRVTARPAEYLPGTPPGEVLLTLGWGAVAHLDMEPATCGDETCEADHGYTGTLTSDDLTLRVSAAADGAEIVDQVIAFGRAISEATARLG